MIYTSRAAELPVETVQETPDPEATVITDATADIAADSADNITIEDLFPEMGYWQQDMRTPGRKPWMQIRRMSPWTRHP